MIEHRAELEQNRQDRRFSFLPVVQECKQVHMHTTVHIHKDDTSFSYI